MSRDILITGGAGFIGGHLAEALLKHGDRVTAVDSLNGYYDIGLKEETLQILQSYNEEADTTGKPPIFTFHKCLIENETDLRGVFQKAYEKKQGKPAFDCVVHLAAQAGVRYSVEHPAEVMILNVIGTQRVLDMAKEFKVPYVVASSSSSVYGMSSVTPFSEDQPCNKPVSPYAASKRANEMQAHAWHHLTNIPVTMLRFFTVYGPRGRPDMAAFQFIDKITKGEAIDKFGDGSAIREFTFVDDIVHGIMLSIQHVPAGNGFRIINLGGGAMHTLNEFIATIEKHIGKSAVINQKPNQPGDMFITSACLKLAKAELGFEPKISLDQGIRRTVEWYKNFSYLQGGKGAPEDAMCDIL